MSPDSSTTQDLLLAYYGDDFTGSTDVMEALSLAGLRTVLFLDVPTPEQLNRFSGLRAFGIAGGSRTFSPEEMEEKVTPVFTHLQASGAPLIHYKICSTCDSSPRIGSIGKIIDLAFDIFQPSYVPVLAGAPVLGRYCVFGNVFARSGLESEPYRLDRHPTMRSHPITPMEESDLRRLLAAQTNRSIGLFDVLKLEQPNPERAFADRNPSDILLFDVLREEHLPVIGRLIWKAADRNKPSFVVGSSGIEYALTAHCRAEQIPGILDPDQASPFPRRMPPDPLVVVSGSCSPVTDRQIEVALANGFREVPIDTPRLVSPKEQEEEVRRVCEEGRKWFGSGHDVILHAARGPEDPRIAKTVEAMKSQGWTDPEIRLRSGRLLGPPLGRLLDRFLSGIKIARVAVAGGDTSSYVARELGIEALEFKAPIAPGSPLCRARAPRRAVHGREIVFKGGQVGREDWFLHLGQTAAIA